MSEPQEFPSYPVDRDPEPREPPLPASRPPRAASTGHLVGRVDGATTRVEGRGERSSETVVSFRLLDAGERPVEVELRGTTVTGTVRDGDWVEVADRRRDGRIEPLSLANLSTGSQVRTVGNLQSPGVRVMRVVFIVFFIAILIAVVAIGWQVFRGFQSF